MIKKLDFPEGYGQIEDGWCGPNVMRQVILHMKGLYVPEKDLVNMSNCSISKGTTVENMLKVADKFNLNYFVKHNSSIQDLINSVNEGNPVILLIQAWSDNKITDWTGIKYCGHYVAAHDKDEKIKMIYYYDPCDGKNKPISYRNLEERWHDIDFKKNIEYKRFGIFFKN